MSSRWLTTRELAVVAIFSALWAAVEILIGTILVMIRLPFRGAILTAIALLLIVAVRQQVPKKGTAIAMGVIVGAIRLIMGGPKVLTIAPALVIEGALIEAAFVLLPGVSSQLTRMKCATAGVLAITYSFLHTILMVGLITGLRKQQFTVVIEYLEGLKFGLYSLWLALLLLVVAHGVLGGAAGIISWRLTRGFTHDFAGKNQSGKNMGT